MPSGARFPGNQAEVVFSDVFVEQLEELTASEREDVLVKVVACCQDPGGKHPLHSPLGGWNTVEVNQRNRRVVYRGAVVAGTGLVEVLCVAPRSDNEVYDMAAGLVGTQLLTDAEATQLWDALAVLDIMADRIGLDPWDYRPEPAPEGLQKAAVAAGIVDAGTAAVMSQDELVAAMQHGYDDQGLPDPFAAVQAALDIAARRLTESRPPYDPFATRRTDRCGAWMPRADAACTRRRGHPGPHRRGGAGPSG
ncbi:MAG: hypothetical protein ACR2HR_02185 [Euzebya sp.]